MSAVASAAQRDQFAGRTRDELAAMCALRDLPVSGSDVASQLRRRLRDDVATRRREDPAPRVVTPTADRDTAARMALIDGEVRMHFATSPDPASARAVASALRRNQQEVLLALSRLGCPRLHGGLYGPPSTPTQETTP